MRGYSAEAMDLANTPGPSDLWAMMNACHPPSALSAEDVSSRIRRWFNGQPVRLSDVGPLWGAEVVVAVCAVAGVVVSARVLGTSEYGVAALAMSVPQLIYSILEARGGQATVKYVARYREQGRLDRARSVGLLAFAVDGAVGAVALLASVAVSPWVASGLLEDSSRWILVAGFALGVFFRAPITASADTLTALGRFRTVGSLRSAGAVVRLGVTVAALAISGTVGALVMGFLVGMVIEAIVFVVAVGRITSEELGSSIFGAGLGSLVGQRRELGRFIAYSDLSSLLRVFATQSDVLVLGFFASTSEVGVYRLARQLTAPVISVIVPIQSVLFARISATVERSGFASARRDARRVGQRLGMPLGALILAGIPLSGFGVRLAGGDEFAGAERPTQILLGLAAVWAFTLWINSLLLASGRVRDLTVVALVATLTTLTGFLLLGPAFDAGGIATSRLIGQGIVGQSLGLLLVARAASTTNDESLSGR